MSTAASVNVPADVSDRPETARDLGRALGWARREYSEHPEAALVEAMRCHEVAASIGHLGIAARALSLQGIISVHRGDLHSGVTLAVPAAHNADRSGDAAAQAEVAGLRALLSYFAGDYAEALHQADAAVSLADRDGDPGLRLHVRRVTCPVFGNLNANDLRGALELTLTLAGDDPREQAFSRNDIATQLAENGELDAAERELEVAFALIDGRSDARFARATLLITRAEVRLAAGDHRRALIDARRGVELLSGDSNPNPYLLGAAITTEVRSLIAIGAVDEARRIGEETVATLGDRLPQMRGMILSTLAAALHESGRPAEAYSTLARASELEREAFRELAELKLGLERATLETREARRHSESLMARNRQLVDAHAELERRSSELEKLQGQLLEQAERDWLTGLYNRRFLARQLEDFENGDRAGPVSVAIVDIDHFKAINDRFGHSTGDQVLVRIARVLGSMLHRHDAAIRSGGEEFLLVMAGSGAIMAARRCERIRARIEAQPWHELVPGLTVTASIGVGSTVNPRQIREIVTVGDQRLYAAKRAGRNRVVAE